MTGNLLSDAALHQVRELIRQESGRARGERTWYEPPLTKGPECFLAYTSTGIDGMTSTTPGYADCDLYELATDGTLSALMLDGSTNNTRTIYNASASAVGAGYFPVWRDKLGTWWATAAGGAQCAFSGNNTTGGSNTFDSSSSTGIQWDVRNVVVRGSSLVTADTTNDWWNLAAAGLWHIWGSVTVSCDTADSMTTHRLSYSTDGGSTWTNLDTQYYVHPVAGYGFWATIYLAGAVDLTADSKIRLLSKTDSTALGRAFESNLHFLLV